MQPNMRITKLIRIGSIVVLTGSVVLTLHGMAHAGEWCFFGICFPIPDPPTPHSVPEIDAGMAVSGVTMLVASALVIVDRFRRR
jgi:hypothetical protein